MNTQAVNAVWSTASSSGEAPKESADRALANIEALTAQLLETEEQLGRKNRALEALRESFADAEVSWSQQHSEVHAAFERLGERLASAHAALQQAVSEADSERMRADASEAQAAQATAEAAQATAEAAKATAEAAAASARVARLEAFAADAEAVSAARGDAAAASHASMHAGAGAAGAAARAEAEAARDNCVAAELRAASAERAQKRAESLLPRLLAVAMDLSARLEERLVGAKPRAQGPVSVSACALSATLRDAEEELSRCDARFGLLLSMDSADGAEGAALLGAMRRAGDRVARAVALRCAALTRRARAPA